MKKINLAGKLLLKKETISRLGEDQMASAMGGRVAYLDKESSPSKCKKTEAGPSSPCNNQTCQGATCVYIDGC